MKVNKLAYFIVLAYAAYLAGGWLIDSYLAAIVPSLFTGIIGDAIRFALPTTIFFFGWKYFGKER